MHPKYDLAFRLTDPDDWYVVELNHYVVFEGSYDDCMAFIKSHSKGA